MTFPPTPTPLSCPRVLQNTLIDEEDPSLGGVVIRAGFHCGPVGESVASPAPPAVRCLRPTALPARLAFRAPVWPFPGNGRAPARVLRPTAAD